jgi:L-2-hydroxycarboxylate dehydrogenase (NAD+)
MLVSYKKEIKLCEALLHAKGMNDVDAGILAHSVAYSDFTGIYSHGLSRFSNYLKRFANGAYTINAQISIASDTGSTVAFDCDDGCGVIAAMHVYEQMKARVKQQGIVIATGRRASNIGCGAFFGRQAAKDDLIMLLCCNTTRCVAPFGGADSVLGTNPVVVCAPANEERPLLLDISTTNVAFGKVQAFAREGKELPAGWALDADGKPTTDAKAAKTVLPIAGPKGYGLAVMIEMFSALLAGSGYGEKVGFASKGQHENTGFSMILIDPSKFMPIDEFKNSVDTYIRTLKSGRKAENVNEIYMPGEIEMRRFDQNVPNGYEVSEALQAELVGYAVEFGVAETGTSFEDLISKL